MKKIMLMLVIISSLCNNIPVLGQSRDTSMALSSNADLYADTAEYKNSEEFIRRREVYRSLADRDTIKDSNSIAKLKWELAIANYALEVQRSVGTTKDYQDLSEEVLFQWKNMPQKASNDFLLDHTIKTAAKKLSFEEQEFLGLLFEMNTAMHGYYENLSRNKFTLEGQRYANGEKVFYEVRMNKNGEFVGEYCLKKKLDEYSPYQKFLLEHFLLNPTDYNVFKHCGKKKLKELSKNQSTFSSPDDQPASAAKTR